MNTSSRRPVASNARPSGHSPANSRASAARPSARKRPQKSATDIAISTELAPAVAIALLDKSSHAPGSPPPALDVLAAGVTASDTEGKVRVQLMFSNGAVLPVEMSADAGAALSKGLDEEILDKK